MIPANLISVIKPLRHRAINNGQPFLIRTIGLLDNVYVVMSGDNTEHIGNVEFEGDSGMLVRLQDGSPVELLYSEITSV